MVGKAKKIVSLAHKEKLLAEIAHYEKRIQEALNKRKHFSVFENESIEENVANPYKFKLQPSQNELKQQEASLSARASKTLELGMLTVMQSEVNVMVTAPEVRKPVPEDGIWYEVAAECKIDLVSFAITFYAHKPHRKFAPTRYRNVTVTPFKPAHQKELDQSILPKQHLPNLALQMLQSYATAFRSRRTTLLELAEKYADKLRMEAMPEGGYRVRFLQVLQVEWAVENLWSPIVPFCHRMKFEVEYMPKDYIQAIGKLYKQFKDPSLETSERTLVLSRIFDICLQAAGPARELQDSLESDPETAGRLHERRTTIDQEPDVPNVDQSPKKKEPVGKENRPQNRKTNMAPPKTIPKRAKSKPMVKDFNEIRKSVKRAIESANSNGSKKSRISGSDISKPGLKGGRVGINKENETAEAGLKTVKDNTKDTGKEANNRETVAGLENNVLNKPGKASAKHTKDTDSAETATSEKDITKKRDGKTIKSKVGDAEGGDINNAKKNKDVDSSKSSEAGSKGSKEDAKTKEQVTKSKDVNTDNNAARTKKSADNIANINNNKTTDKNTVNTKDRNVENNVTLKKVNTNKTNTQNEKTTDKNTVKSKVTEKEAMGSKKIAESTANKKGTKKVASTNDEGCVKNSEHGDIGNSKEKIAVIEVAVPKIRATIKKDGKAANTKENSTENKLSKTKQVNDKDTVSRTSSKTVASNTLKYTNKEDSNSNKVSNTAEKEANADTVGSVREVNDKTKPGIKKPTQKNVYTAKQKVVSSVINKKNVKENLLKQTDKVVAKRKVAKEKPTGTEKKIATDENNREKTLAEKGKVTKPKGSEQTGLNKIAVDKTKKNLVRTNKTDENEVLAKKRKTEDNVKNIINNDNQPKNSTADKEQSKSNTKPQNTTIILIENPNRETDNEKYSQNTKNMLNVTITKTKSIPISKLQTKIPDKLKTKIPMMKSKMPFPSLGNKLKTGTGATSKGENTKIPHSLPLFKKLAKNPTRMSPRKLPKFKPSAYGFSKK